MGFDYSKLRMLESVLSKEAQFVPPDAMAGGGMPPPEDPAAAGGGMPPADPAMMAGGGMPPVDPAMMGGGMPPVDPAMMGGGMPPMDPAMMGADAGQPGPGDVSPSGEPYMKITPTQLSKLFKQFAEVFKSVLGIGGQAQPGQPAQAAPQMPAQDQAMQQKMVELDSKMDAILGVLQ